MDTQVILDLAEFSDKPFLIRASNSLLRFPLAKAVRKTVLKVNSFIFMELMGSKWALYNIFRTRDMFQEGTSLLVPADLFYKT